MKDMRGLFLVLLVLGLGLGVESRANTIPAININDTTGPITITGSGFKSFSSGTIAGNPEAVWWYATGTTSLGNGLNAGIWTEPGSSGVSDEFYIVTAGKTTYGFFLSDPAVVPTSFTIPGSGITIDLTKLGFSTSVETGLPTQLSPNAALLSVMATSSVPDGGTTVILLGLGIGGLVWFGRRRARKGPEA